MHGYKRFITKMRSMLFVSRSLNLTIFSCFLIKLHIYTYTNLNNWPLRPRPTGINVLTPCTCVTIIYFKSVLK